MYRQEALLVKSNIWVIRSHCLHMFSLNILKIKIRLNTTLTLSETQYNFSLIKWSQCFTIHLSDDFEPQFYFVATIESSQWAEAPSFSVSVIFCKWGKISYLRLLKFWFFFNSSNIAHKIQAVQKTYSEEGPVPIPLLLLAVFPEVAIVRLLCCKFC